MTSEAEEGLSRKRRRLNPPETGPYILRSLIDSVPLNGDGAEEDISITCVELYGMFWA